MESEKHRFNPYMPGIAELFPDYADDRQLFIAKGKPLKDVLRLSPADVIDAWGELPGGNVHCAILAVSTLHKALADYLIKTQNG